MADWLSPEEWRAVALSLKVSFWAVLVSLPVIALVLLLQRFSRDCKCAVTDDTGTGIVRQ